MLPSLMLLAPLMGTTGLVVVSGLDSRACAIGGQTSFEDYARKKGRTNTSTEYQTRRTLYERNAQQVRDQNCRSGATWKAALNKFSDWTHDELQQTLGEYGVSRPVDSASSLIQAGQSVMSDLPKTVDWTNLTASQDVQDQGACGSCWAVAAATLLRLHTEIATGVDKGMFSVQQLVSCVPNPQQCGGKGGCKGATCDLALKYVMKRGLKRASEFPYEERDDVACPTQAQVGSEATSMGEVRTSVLRGSAAGISGEDGDDMAMNGASLGMTGFSQIPENKLEPLMRVLYEVGPAKVSISIPEGFHQYDSGVMDACPKDSIVTHGAVLLGYGEDSVLGVKYWKLQNSWGPEWGEDGRFRFLRHSKEHEENDSCGWDSHPEKGNGCLGGPSRLRVCGTCAILSNAVVPHFVKSQVQAAPAHRHSFAQ